MTSELRIPYDATIVSATSEEIVVDLRDGRSRRFTPSSICQFTKNGDPLHSVKPGGSITLWWRAVVTGVTVTQRGKELHEVVLEDNTTVLLPPNAVARYPAPREWRSVPVAAMEDDLACSICFSELSSEVRWIGDTATERLTR